MEKRVFLFNSKNSAPIFILEKEKKYYHSHIIQVVIRFSTIVGFAEQCKIRPLNLNEKEEKGKIIKNKTNRQMTKRTQNI